MDQRKVNSQANIHDDEGSGIKRYQRYQRDPNIYEMHKNAGKIARMNQPYK